MLIGCYFCNIIGLSNNDLDDGGIKMAFPYKNQFNLYCKNEKKLSTNTIDLANKSVNTFWNYYATGSDDPNINIVNETDIRNFLDSLETELKFKKNTINKYLSHLKMYFTYLYSHQFIDNYPILTISGRNFSRKQTYKINWMDKLPQIAQIDNIHPETIKFMAAISLGYKPTEVLSLRLNTLLNGLKDEGLKQYLKNHTEFHGSDNPYIISKKDGGHYASDFHIVQNIQPDKKLLGMPLTLQALRLSYVYSILSDSKKTDEELEEILRVNKRSLVYYRKNFLLYVNAEEFTL